MSFGDITTWLDEGDQHINISSIAPKLEKMLCMLLYMDFIGAPEVMLFISKVSINQK